MKRGSLTNLIEVPRRARDARLMWWTLCLMRWLERWFGRFGWLQAFEIKLTQSLQIFDRDFYQRQLDGQGLPEGMSPLRHYVLHGDAAGLLPAPLFDLVHYDSHCGPRHGFNRLLHYALVARFAGQSPSPWFDVEHYLRTNPDVGAAGVDPFRHFLHHGWAEGRSPLPGLDMRRLVRLQPGLASGQPAGGASGLRVDVNDLRRLLSDPEAPEQDWMPDVLDPAVWADLVPRSWDSEPQVDVFIPVYAGRRETLRCLWSVLAAPVRTPHRVVVINDAGPEAALNAMLRSLAARDLFVLEQHTRNQGFVRTVNHGLKLAGRRDVVILNSDTEVYHDWLDRLLAHARQHPRLGTITPLSNNATICSYPQTLADNRLPLELSHPDIDQLAAQANAGQHVTAPTGVGFCMYIRREALDEVGHLDERRFGRGYGEENDLCQRFLQKGWRNALACDVYVRHVGSVSFQGEAVERVRHALRTLAKLYPNYDGDVAHYIAQDPARPHRIRLDLARLARMARQRNVLLVCHSRGGGTERHLQEQAAQLRTQGYGVFELRPASGAGPRVSLLHADLLGLYNLAALELHPSDLLDEALRRLRITELHIHHLIDFDPQTGALLAAAARRHGIFLRLAVHDYHLVCPRVNLVNAAGRYCGEPAAAVCNHCLAQAPQVADGVSIETWREASGRLLAAAQRVIVPSQDVAGRLRTLLPGVQLEVEPHDQAGLAGLSRHRPAAADEPVRLLVIGAINPIKGLDVMLSLMPLLRAQQPACEMALLGYSSDDAALAAAGVRLLGRYFDEELLRRIEEADPHLILVPSVWPETYCYVLSGALDSGRKVAVFDLGAQAERTREHDSRHLVLPLRLIDDPAGLRDALLAGARSA